MCRWSAFRGIPLPKDWPECVKAAVIQCAALAHRSITNSRSFAINGDIGRVCLACRLDSAKNEIALLLVEIRIKDARMAKLAPHRRPRYAAQDNMAILKLGAARAWILAETAQAFMVEPETIADCTKRAGHASDWLLEISQPVNKYPDYVRYIIQRLKTLCPTMGKVRIAQMLARAGLRVGATTVGRILKEAPLPDKPEVAVASSQRYILIMSGMLT